MKPNHIRITIAETRRLKDYENLTDRLGLKLGRRLYYIVNAADIMDKELDILHDCITELYNNDSNVFTIKNALNKIDKLKNP